jgi:MFS family permease
VTWGIFAIAMGFINGDVSFFVTRFLLGVAEAGFFPGVIYYLTLWFPAEYRGRIFGLFLIISPLNNTIAAPLGGLILKYCNGLMGYPGWRWLFIIEGLPTLLMAYLCLRVVVDRPDRASWLTDAEKAHLRAKLQREAEARIDTRHLSLWQTLGHPKVLLFAVVYTSLAIGIYGLSLWMPQLIKGMGVKDSFHIGLIMAIPYLIATICMVLWSRHSDRTGERVFHCAGALGLAAIGMVTSAFIDSPVLAMGALTLAAVGMYSKDAWKFDSRVKPEYLFCVANDADPKAGIQTARFGGTTQVPAEVMTVMTPVWAYTSWSRLWSCSGI